MENEKFTYFWKNKSPFSQWYKCTFEEHGIIFNCAEQYMMYSKAQLMGDLDSMRLILTTSNPRDQKNLGRLVQNFDNARWELNKKNVVYTASTLKFSQNEDLLHEMMETLGTTLVEASPYDKIWGIGMEESNPKALQRETWNGLNLLGEILTKVREDLVFIGKFSPEKI